MRYRKMIKPGYLPRFSPRRILWISAAVSVLWIVVIAWVNAAEPFAAGWNDWILGILNLIASLAAAVAAVVVAGQFQRKDEPHRVWLNFAIGLCCWVAGELSGLAYGAFSSSDYYPDFSLIDFFWISGYFFLGLSLYHQFNLVQGVQKKRGLLLYLGLIALALAATAGLSNLALGSGLGAGHSWIILFVTILYPVFDLTEGAIALRLSFLFGRGRWSRPWWGLILFALADGVDSFYWLGGYEWISAGAQTALNTVSVIVYTASYLVAGLALLINYFILRYGKASGLFKSGRETGLENPGQSQNE